MLAAYWYLTSCSAHQEIGHAYVLLRSMSLQSCNTELHGTVLALLIPGFPSCMHVSAHVCHIA